MRLVLLGTLLAGCTLYDSRSDDDDIGPPPPPGGGPVGRTFLIERNQTQPSGCSPFTQENQSHNVDVESTTTAFVDGIQPAGLVIRAEGARESNGGPPNVVFTVFETWNGVEGSASPSVQYDIWVEGNLITGKARTSFPNPGPEANVCVYAWTLSSF